MTELDVERDNRTAIGVVEGVRPGMSVDWNAVAGNWNRTKGELVFLLSLDLAEEFDLSKNSREDLIEPSKPLAEFRSFVRPSL